MFDRRDSALKGERQEIDSHKKGALPIILWIRTSFINFLLPCFLSSSFIFFLLDNVLPWAYKTKQFSTVVTGLLTRLLSNYEVHDMGSNAAGTFITPHLHVQNLVLAIQVLMQLMEIWRWLLKDLQRFSIDNLNRWFIQHSVPLVNFNKRFYRLSSSLSDTETIK